jgi:hypothetical protein
LGDRMPVRRMRPAGVMSPPLTFRKSCRLGRE